MVVLSYFSSFGAARREIILEVANKFLRKGSSTARISGGSTVATPAAHISLIPSFTLGCLSLSLPSFAYFLLFWGTRITADRDREGLKMRRTRGVLRSRAKGEQKRERGGCREKKRAELNLQVRLFGHLPVSPRCPLLYLSTCALSLLLLSSSALPLFSPECHWPKVWLVMAFQRV